LKKKKSKKKKINEDELAKTLSKIPGVKVQQIVFENLSLKDQLEVLQKTSVLVGTHGSGLSNVIFLKDASALIEIFPYQFERMSFQQLAQVARVSYFSWQNKQKEKATFHPQFLESMSQTERENVMQDPKSIFRSWSANLYWINQDTVVNCLEIKKVVEQALGIKTARKVSKKKRSEL